MWRSQISQKSQIKSRLQAKTVKTILNKYVCEFDVREVTNLGWTFPLEEDAMLNLPKSLPLKKQTHLHLG